MKALVFHEKNKWPQLEAFQNDSLKRSQVCVEVKAAALNRRDYWITRGLYPGLKVNTILGSDCAGLFNGKEVIINPGLNWGASEIVQSADFEVLGMPSHGTFAEQVFIEKDRIHEKPSHLSLIEASALPLAGVTAYRSLFTKGQLKAGERVLISGVGGGVATFAMQFALAAGANVYVTSGSQSKIEKAKEFGCLAGQNYRDENWSNNWLKQGLDFNLIIDSAAGEGFKDLVKLAAPGARIVIYGGTQGKIQELNPQLLFWRQVEIKGSTMGTDQDFKDMIDFVNTHKIVPIIDSVFDIEKHIQAFEKMKNGTQFGKIVLKIA